LLPLVELATASEVTPKEIHYAVDDEQTVFAASELLSHVAQQLVLMFAVLGSSVKNVVDGRLTVHTEALTNLLDSFWAECSFGVCAHSSAVPYPKFRSTTLAKNCNLAFSATRLFR
jgi:hypothetical protein